ncbi:class I adenylate-forming enzyme family protein [Pseudosulfitobacter pseudonitzschiae]|uniref:class I adenylate-forming enzyme family protein n=1 Tax=Pseudosulfitobacter pseudonitzschiae TaxID=1402135 RepID=UPI001AFC5465|nr:class I adenylate-forming enzyme family protein [Pseudosulfitobacter pseudonitzschiae]MBM1817074.1 acyl--CoA ligase [Pseudosulfitobacter pseudonitzschiae]MBM1834077.1 acyl--CoA ligase [Pseudosulfitobacter pseudonitzschiae]MBM1838943.1 acyl--CoA ligase [Pseudosulfitobacter pseudonitzschiae]MBM1843792.1 acyl--CoA ligase [Pseudosulfitobacter pseudonitzschiae]MBM1848639.1 acyl--CoA ligase [Pseudosulfitobacter pseudonitzschiae]
MLSIFAQGVHPRCPAPFNMADHVLRAGAARPDHLALSILQSDHSDDWTYAALIAAVRGTATGLLQHAQAGQMVLMRLGNTVDFPIAYLGAIWAGLVPIPTSAALTDPEVAAILSELPVAAILRDPVVSCPDDARCIPLDALQAMRALAPADAAMGDPDRLAYVIYTSGTSGKPRAVAHAHRAIWARGMMHQGWYGLRADDRLCHAGAFNWTYTLGTGLMDPWTLGATALIPAPGTPAAELPDLLARHRATIFAAAPGVYRQMLKGRDTLPLPALRHGLSAGEKLPDRIRDAWTAATGTPVYEAYGMSECSTFISASPTNPATHGASGQPQPGRHIAIVDDTGTPQPIGQPGIIAVHRSDPGLMLEYIGAPDETAQKFAGDWFLTGDEAQMDADYQVTYLGRADDMMNAGGYRVSPIEVEQALLSHDGITAVAATDVLVKADNRVIAAFYTGPAALDETELKAWAEPRLAQYKRPRLFVHVDALPTGANNKILRRQLRAAFDAGQITAT